MRARPIDSGAHDMSRSRNTTVTFTTLSPTAATATATSSNILQSILSHALLLGILLTSFGLTGCAELAYDLAQEAAQERCEREPTPSTRAECIARNSHNRKTYPSELARAKNGK
jgi:hypothetical protein